MTVPALNPTWEADIRRALAEAKARFGREDGKTLDMAFVCPKCGHVQTVKDFVDRGLEPDRAAKECIGRHVDGAGCDWAAYGLFGTLGAGRFVMLPDGHEVQVFDFAPGREVNANA